MRRYIKYLKIAPQNYINFSLLYHPSRDLVCAPVLAQYNKKNAPLIPPFPRLLQPLLVISFLTTNFLYVIFSFQLKHSCKSFTFRKDKARKNEIERKNCERTKFGINYSKTTQQTMSLLAECVMYHSICYVRQY